MQINKVKELVSDTQEFLQEDTDKLIEAILLSDDLNCHYGENVNMTHYLALGVKVYEAMVKGIGEKEAYALLEEYEEAQDKVRMMEKEYWVKAGIRIGSVFAHIVNNSAK